MKRVCIVILALAACLISQTVPELSTLRLDFPLPDLQKVQQASASVVGRPAGATYYYWLVANNVIGNASPAGPFIAYNAPVILDSSNYVTVRWTLPTGAVSVDLLRTSTPAPPSAACGCAVATGISGQTSYNDQTNSLSAYTVNTFDPGTVDANWKNVQDSAGVSKLLLSFNEAPFAYWDSTGDLFSKSIEQVRYADQWCTTPGTLDQTCLLNAASGWSGPIEIPKGTYSIASNTAISNPLIVDPGAVLSVATGVTLTLDGTVQAGNYQIFSLAGTGFLQLSQKVPYIYPQWYGATGNGTTDDTTAVQDAMTAAEHATTYVGMLPGTYLISSTVQLGDPATGCTSSSNCPANMEPGPRGVVGLGRDYNAVQFLAKSTLTGPVLQRLNQANETFKGFSVNGYNVADCVDLGIYNVSGPAAANVIKDITCYNAKTTGFTLDNQNDSVIKDLVVATNSTRTGTVSGSYSIHADAETGQLDLFNIHTYGNTGAVFLSAQNGGVHGGFLGDGIELGGSAWNNIAIVDTQIAPNHTTGISINSTNVGGEGTDNVTCIACYLTTVGSGQSLIAGKFYEGFAAYGGRYDKGSGSLFGTITSTATPTFSFTGSEFTNSPVAPNLGNLVLNGTLNPSTPEITNFLEGAGSSSRPAYSFSGDSGSGMFLSTAGQVGISAGNATNLLLTNYGPGQEVLLPVTAATSGGNVSSPERYYQANCWNGSASTGDYWIWQNVLGTGSSATSTLDLTHVAGCGGATVVNVGATLQQSGVPVVTTTGTQTLANKTLTSPTITGTGTAAFSSLTLGSGPAMTNPPELLWNSFDQGPLTNTIYLTAWTPAYPITVRRIEASVGTTAVGCTTSPVVTVSNGTATQTLTIANGSATSDTGAIAVNFSAGTQITAQMTTAAAGCMTSPAQMNLTIAYTMQ